jgi:hypothetical protein
MDEQNEQNKPTPTMQPDASAVGGYYHGPSNVAGPTDREYWELLERAYDEREREYYDCY